MLRPWLKFLLTLRQRLPLRLGNPCKASGHRRGMVVLHGELPPQCRKAVVLWLHSDSQHHSIKYLQVSDRRMPQMSFQGLAWSRAMQSPAQLQRALPLCNFIHYRLKIVTAFVFGRVIPGYSPPAEGMQEANRHAPVKDLAGKRFE